MEAIATVYQTKSKSHDLALTASEKKAKLLSNGMNTHKVYPCGNEAIAFLAITAETLKNNCKFNLDVIRLQLLLREKLAMLNINTLKDGLNDTEVSFDICEYMRLIGYDDDDINISSHKANVTRNINKALFMLQHLMFQIGTPRQYVRFCMITTVKRNHDLFTVKFSSEFIQQIILSATKVKNGQPVIGQGLFSKFSRSLYSLSDRNELLTLFYLETRFSIRNNARHRVNNRISIGVLADFLSLPKTREEVKQFKTTNYYRTMVEPVVQALLSLQSKGFISFELKDVDGSIVTEQRIAELKHTPEAFFNVMVVFNCNI